MGKSSSVLVPLYNDQVEPLYNARLGPHYIEAYPRFSPCILKRLPRWNQEKHSIGMLRFMLVCVDGFVPHTWRVHSIERRCSGQSGCHLSNISFYSGMNTSA